MRKFVALFGVRGVWEHLRLFADNMEEAKDIAISVYQDYVKDGFIPSFNFVTIYEIKQEKEYGFIIFRC